MKRIFALLAGLAFIAGCTDTDPIVIDTFRGNPISGPQEGILRASGGPYLATDTLKVLAGRTLVIEAGTDLRFEPGIPFVVEGRINAEGSEAAPIIFTSGLRNPVRGDWDGIWLVNADNGSTFKYCRFQFGAKFGRRYNRFINEGEEDSSRVEYGALTLLNSSPTIEHNWFIAGGFHGLHCDDGANPTVRNNVFFDNAGHGIYVHANANPTINMNIISENDDYGLFCAMPGEARRGDFEFNYNLVIENFSGEYNLNAPLEFGRIARANGNLDSCDIRFNLRLNPEFVAASKIKNGVSWDFRLNAWSSAIDAGPIGVDEGDGTRPDVGVHHYIYSQGEIRRLFTTPTLSASGSPYTLTSNIYLPVGQSLTIEPGVTIRVNGRFQMTIAGRILTQGTSGAPVRMISNASTPTPGDWVGVVFQANGDPGSILAYTEIRHARVGVKFSSQDARLNYCTISESDSVGIYCDNISSPSIEHCKLQNNAISGILCRFNSSPSITNTTISGGRGYGILALSASMPRIENCIIRNVETNGIRLENLSNATIINNVIASNQYFGLFCSNNSSPDVRNNIFYSNGTDLRGGNGVYAENSSRPTIAYNVFWGNAASPVWISGSTTMDPSNFATDPLFANTAAGDYTLGGASRCIDAGDPNPVYNDVNGTRNDIGAFGGPNAG